MENKTIQSSLSFEELYDIASNAVLKKQKRGLELSDIELELLLEQASGDDAANLAIAISGMSTKK